MYSDPVLGKFKYCSSPGCGKEFLYTAGSIYKIINDIGNKTNGTKIFYERGAIIKVDDETFLLLIPELFYLPVTLRGQNVW